MQKVFKAASIIGGMAGFFFVLLFLVLFVTKTSMVSMLYWADLPILVFFVFLSLIYFRDYLNYRQMKLFEGFMVGCFTSTFSAIIISAFVYIFLTDLQPDIIQKDINGAIAAINKLNDTGQNIYIEEFGKEAHANQISAYQKITTSMISKNKFSAIIGIGFLFSVVFSIFLRKRPDAN